MLNTSAPLFGKDNFKTEIERQQAELYARLYPIAAEDFVAHPDLKRYEDLLKTCINSIQQQISTLATVIAQHTHTVPPHTHPIEPHFHISPETGVPTSPNTNALVTLPTPITTNVPVQTAQIKWNTIQVPRFQNTTGSQINMEGNRITVGASKVGPMVMSKRRLKPPKDALKVSLLPVVSKIGP